MLDGLEEKEVHLCGIATPEPATSKAHLRQLLSQSTDNRIILLAAESDRPGLMAEAFLPTDSPEAGLRNSSQHSDAARAATAELTTAESSADWTDIADGWQRAIASLGDIPISSDDYSQAQVKIAEYERNYEHAIAQRTATEAAAAAAIAQQQAEEQAIAQRQEAAEAPTALSVVTMAWPANRKNG